MDTYKLINKLFESLNKLISINVRTTKYSNELIETLKIIENCTSCKKVDIKENDFDEFHKLINKIKSEKKGIINKLINKIKSEKGEENDDIIDKLNGRLIEIDDKLNRNILCEGCKEKKVEKLITKCGNEEMAKLLYESKLNSDNIYYLRWIPFSEFGNIKYLAKGGFGEVQKAVWFGYYYGKEREVVLKTLYNSRDKILDILKEVNKKKSLMLMLINYLLKTKNSM